MKSGHDVPPNLLFLALVRVSRTSERNYKGQHADPITNTTAASTPRFKKRIGCAERSDANFGLMVVR